MKSLERLVEIASEPISTAQPDLGWAVDRGIAGALVEDLTRLLQRKNGFFAFQNALLVLPSRSDGAVIGLDEWNDPEGWIRVFDRLPVPTLFYAQDVFAGQYGITASGVIGLEPETGEVTLHGDSLEEWCDTILRDYDLETGWSVAREWQLEHRPLRPGERLLPRKPFVLGGDYASANLVAVEQREAMRRLGALYRQIRDVPDGAPLTITGWI